MSFQVGDIVKIIGTMCTGETGTVVVVGTYFIEVDLNSRGNYIGHEEDIELVPLQTLLTMATNMPNTKLADKGAELYSYYYSGVQVTFYENGIQLNSHFETIEYWTYASYQYIDDKIGTFRGFAATNMPDILDMFNKLTAGSRTGISNKPKYSFETFTCPTFGIEREAITGMPAEDYAKINLPRRIRDTL